MNHTDLAGKRILITRPQLQANIFAAKLEKLNAHPVILPSIEIKPAPDLGPLRRAIGNLDQYDGVIFTSINGAKFFVDEVIVQQQENLMDTRIILAVGTSTKKYLNERGISVDVVPEVFEVKEILEKLEPGKRYLIPQGNRASIPLNSLPADVQIDKALVYYNTFTVISDEQKAQLEQDKFDFVTLTSASCAAGVLGWYSPALLPETLTASIAVCIGPNTAETAEESGFENVLIAQEHTTDGMIDRMLKKVTHES